MQANINKRPIVDLIYSFVAYALPTFMLQFVILPFIAKQLPSEENGLFLTLFNTVRLFVTLLIIPLSNIRLLKKKECISDSENEKGFNFLFVAATLIAVFFVSLLGTFYYGWVFDLFNVIRLVAVLILISAHDYFSIAFRVNITYKSILVDNLMIVVGYFLGILLMLKYGFWELIFISGYAFGLSYTLIKTTMWKKGIKPLVKKETVGNYCQLSVSSGLNSATTYCDKMLIYPLIGGYSVSVYNSAAVVSKMMALVSTPLRNVFLSYIVDADSATVSGKKRKLIIIAALGGTPLLYGAFYGAGVLCCRILYPQYFEAALKYIPIILLAILFETYAGLLKVYLLRFEKTILQVVTSCAKIFLYLASVLVLTVVCDLGLLGFCLSILLADSAHFIIALVYFLKNIKNKAKQEKAA